MQLFVLCLSDCQENCKSTLIYEDLKCKPIYAKTGDCCPVKYDCSHIEKRPANKCHLRGVFYEAGAIIDDDLIYGNCHVNCHCQESTEFNCAVLDCPEWLGSRPRPGCYLKQELGKCCAVGEICEPYPEDLAKCEVEDKEYKEGEQFPSPNSNCMECVCQKGFKGKFEEPFCKKSNCSAEIRHSNDIRENCAPAYMNIGDCCPWDWICPEESDVIEVSTIPKKVGIGLQCKFGKKILNIGDKMDRTKIMTEYEKYETKCECIVPPFLTCTKKQIFDVDKAPPHLKAILGGS